MRKTLVTLASLALAIAGVGLSPAAFAANETAQFSSLASGVSVSGSASTTIAPSSDVSDIDFELYLPTSLFTSTQTFNVVGDTSPCATYGMTISYNGVPQSIDQCLLVGPYPYPPIGDVYILGVGSAATPNIGDVVSITWGTNLVTTEAPLNGSTVYVYDFLLGQVPVTPTLLGSLASAIPM